MKKIWVYAEEYQGCISKVTLELLGKATELSKSYDGEVEIAAVLLTCDGSGAVKQLERSGATKLYLGEDKMFSDYCHTIYAPVISELIKKEDPDIFMFGATQTGSDLAPTVAAQVKTGVAAHCVDMYVNNDGNLVADVPAFGGKIIGEILIPDTRPQMASVKPGIFTVCLSNEPKCVEVVKIDVNDVRTIESTLRPLGTFINKSEAKPLEDADLVLVGGYGIGSADNWEKIKKLSDILGGAVGATRPCIDEGWGEGEQIMIGTSGKSIRPKVYLSFGVSGATHHICGMKDSGVILSVNNDENAAIFEVSDCYAVADAEKILDSLIDAALSAKEVKCDI